MSHLVLIVMPSRAARVRSTGKTRSHDPQEVITMALIQHTSLGFTRERSSEGSPTEHERHESGRDTSKDVKKDWKDRRDT